MRVCRWVLDFDSGNIVDMILGVLNLILEIRKCSKLKKSFKINFQKALKRLEIAFKARQVDLKIKDEQKTFETFHQIMFLYFKT